MNQFVRVANVIEIEPGTSLSFQVHDTNFVLFNAWGAFYAVEDCCTGDGASLADASLCGTMIECACDHAFFYLPTGESLDWQTLKPLATHRVWIHGDEISVEVSTAPGTIAQVLSQTPAAGVFALKSDPA